MTYHKSKVNPIETKIVSQHLDSIEIREEHGHGRRVRPKRGFRPAAAGAGGSWFKQVVNPMWQCRAWWSVPLGARLRRCDERRLTAKPRRTHSLCDQKCVPLCNARPSQGVPQERDL